MSATAAVRERPILFSGAMVRAILDGSKTQTRRVVKAQPPPECSIHFMLGQESWLEPEEQAPLSHHWEAWHGPLFLNRPEKHLCGIHNVRCPHGAVGDRLWVRETWECPKQLGGSYQREKLKFREQSDYPAYDYSSVKWQPSIFMPRWASRLTLEITDVRVERVQAISDADAQAEGIEHDGTWWRAGTHPVKGSLQCWPTVRRAYERLWNEINEKRGFGWDVNPWVWVITFNRVAAPVAGHRSEP